MHFAFRSRLEVLLGLTDRLVEDAVRSRSHYELKYHCSASRPIQLQLVVRSAPLSSASVTTSSRAGEPSASERWATKRETLVVPQSMYTVEHSARASAKQCTEEEDPRPQRHPWLQFSSAGRQARPAMARRCAQSMSVSRGGGSAREVTADFGHVNEGHGAMLHVKDEICEPFSMGIRFPPPSACRLTDRQQSPNQHFEFAETRRPS